MMRIVIVQYRSDGKTKMVPQTSTTFFFPDRLQPSFVRSHCAQTWNAMFCKPTPEGHNRSAR
ncbi:MAG: hypothetical protein CMJ74_10755 [Planctomycetaceae bacterium]|nr:hypothetical protein [Planctomycetaceae bacterium]